MKLTYYGYRGDHTDRYTRAGEGTYHRLEYGVSCAVTVSAAIHFRIKPGDWLTLNDGRLRRYDDKCPLKDQRIDLYEKHLGSDSGTIVWVQQKNR